MRFTVLKKFKIIEAQIDSFNDTNNQLQKFDDGVNIICGVNEAGKSTLMDFIKNVFIRKSSDAKGYVKCEYDGESFSLNAGDTKKLKENEKYLAGVTPHDFQTGFVINIDDIMFANKAKAEELLNTIKDSSGNAVNKKQEEYDKYIHDAKKQPFSLTPSNSASANFKKQFDTLKNLDKDINDLMAKEDVYNAVCINLDNTNTELKNIKQKTECANIILQKNNEELRKNDIKINQKVLEHKSDFDKIRLDFGELKSLKDKEEELSQKTEKNQSEFDEKFKELNRLESFDYGDLDEFDLSRDILNFGKNLAEKEKDLNRQKADVLSKITELNKEINEIKFNVKSTENVLVDMGIDSIKSYKEDKNLLESYLESYDVARDKIMNNNSVNTKRGKWYNNMFFILFLAMFFAICGTLIQYWNTGVRLPMIALLLVSIAGINTTIMQNIERKRDFSQGDYSADIKKYANEILKICKKYNYDIKQDDRFIVKVNAFIKKMSDNISEYDVVDNDLKNYRIALYKKESILNDYNEKESDLDKKTEDFNKEKTEFLEKINIKSLQNLEDVFDYVKTLKELQQGINDCKNNLKISDDKMEKFVGDLNKFIQNCDLENFKSYNKYDYPEFDEVIKSIDKIIYENNSAKTLLDDINLKIEKYKNDILNYPDDLVNELAEVDEDIFADLNHSLEEKAEIKAKLTQQKDDLESVSGLYKLRNEKNIKLNNINNALLKLIQKEIIYNVIEKSKEKFNATQPNFVCAKHYFSKITGEKYDEIDFENKTISGENIGDKDWDELSRGTKEQLYLALRLGYANNYSKDIDGNPNGRPDLPIIIDDAFVNFDKARTTAILKCLNEFSKTNQVLYFTCHTDSVKEILKKEKIKHNYIELGE